MRRAAAILALGIFGPTFFGPARLAGQNLFANPDFDSDVAPWIAGCGSTPVWLGEDSAGCGGSGASTQTSGPCQGFQGAGVGQCVSVAGLSELFASARVRASSGFAGVLVFFFAGVNCIDPSTGDTVSPMVPATGEWVEVRFENLEIPPGTASALVGFGALAPGAIEVEVDAAYVGESNLVFRDDFEGDLEGSTDACAWSSTSG